MKVVPKCLLITGASRGIGRALACEYAATGISMALISRDQVSLEETAEICRQRGATVDIGVLDVNEHDALAEWILDYDRRAPIDLVIANAGVALTVTATGQMERMTDVAELFQTNVMGVLATIYPVIERMQQRGGGQVALMSSLGGYAGMPISPAYNASKAALRIYAEGLRGVLADHGIGISVICPGFVATNMSDAYPAHKPFTITPETAAVRIRHGLARNRACIAFPRRLAIVTRALAILPTDFGLRLQRIFGF